MNAKLSARHKRNSTTFDAPVSDIPHELALNPASLQSMRTKTQTHQEELRCVITIIRHGDRTPKQKLKRDIESEDFLKYFEDHSKNTKALKIKEKNEMLSFLELVNASITKLELQGGTNPGVMQKALQIRSVLERSKITGLNRKIQMKPRKWEEGPDGKKTNVSALQLIVLVGELWHSVETSNKAILRLECHVIFMRITPIHGIISRELFNFVAVQRFLFLR
jgi:hypothetical protein